MSAGITFLYALLTALAPLDPWASDSNIDAFRYQAGVIHSLPSSGPTPPTDYDEDTTVGPWTKELEHICHLDPEPGPCRAEEHRYYYNNETEKCDTFIYGGCRGNGNNFKTVDECEHECLEQPFTCPETQGRYQHYRNCHKYYECENGELTIKRCLGGLEFDSEFGCVMKSFTCTKLSQSIHMLPKRRNRMAYSVSSRLDFSEYIYIANLVDELPLNMMSRQDLQRIICTELNGVEQYRFEEDNGAIWLTAFIKFYSKTAAETAVHQLNTKDKIGAATISSLLDQYMQLEDILRSNHSVFCTFSFIIVEQVNMNLTECEIISLFTNYGAVKIAKTSSPMCIGFENFAEALAAKIDQNRWNNSNSYISVKVFPRMKEQVLGFMKARSSCSLASSDSNVFDPFSVCMICDRCVQPHAYEEFNNDHGHIGHLADTHTSQHTFQESISNDIEDIEIESGKQIPKHGLSFDPNDFVFYLRIERKAFTNLNKERRCDSPSSDTGISSDGSSHTVSSSEIRYDVPDSQSNIDNHFVFQTFSQDTPSDQAPCASFQIHNESSKENFTENRNYAAMNYGPQSANDDESDSELQSNETRFTEDFAYPQCSCAYQSHDCTAKTCNLGCSETEVETEFPFTAQQIYSYSNTDSLSGLHISEIEKNFKIYGMKMRPKKQESDPKIILIPFVYYSENDTSPANTYLQGPKVGNMAYSSTSKIESSIRRSSKKISTHTKFRSSSVQEVPVLDERNFPTLREAKDRTTEKPRAQSQKKKIADNAESPVVSTAADTPNEGFREIRNTKIRSDSIETAQLDKKYGRSVKVTNRSFSEPRELQHRDTLKSSFNIKLVFSNKSRYNNHSDTKAQNSSQRSRTEEHSKFMPRNDYSSDEGRNSKFNKRSGPRRIEYSSHDVKSRAIKIVNDRTIRKPQNTKSHSLP